MYEQNVYVSLKIALNIYVCVCVYLSTSVFLSSMAWSGWPVMLQIDIREESCLLHDVSQPIGVWGNYIKFIEVQLVYSVLKEATLRVRKDVCSSSEVVLKNEEASLKWF